MESVTTDKSCHRGTGLTKSKPETFDFSTHDLFSRSLANTAFSFLRLQSFGFWYSNSLFSNTGYHVYPLAADASLCHRTCFSLKECTFPSTSPPTKQANTQLGWRYYNHLLLLLNSLGGGVERSNTHPASENPNDKLRYCSDQVHSTEFIGLP